MTANAIAMMRFKELVYALHSPVGLSPDSVENVAVLVIAMKKSIIANVLVIIASFVVNSSVLFANEKVQICHNNHTIWINKSAVQPHLDHGDQLGPCWIDQCIYDGNLKNANRALKHLEMNLSEDGLALEDIGLVKKNAAPTIGEARRSHIYEMENGTIGINTIIWVNKNVAGQILKKEAGIYKVSFKITLPNGEVVDLQTSYDFKVEKPGTGYTWRYENQGSWNK